MQKRLKSLGKVKKFLQRYGTLTHLSEEYNHSPLLCPSRAARQQSY